MKVLIACEESQVVCKAFRERGHEAYSCDILLCSGGHPEWHIQGDVLNVIKAGQIWFQNDDRKYIHKWDMMLGFPPCTHLAVSGARHFEEKRNDGRQQQGIDFFMALVNAPIEKIAIENPVGIMSSEYRKPDQIIQPYYFGDEAQKTTCLWLKGLPLLFHASETDLFNSEVTHSDKGEMVTFKSGKRMSKWMAESYGDGRTRSKTFPGIANAMAEQWG